MTPWPRSLAGRTALVMVGVLVLVQGAGLTIYGPLEQVSQETHTDQADPLTEGSTLRQTFTTRRQVLTGFDFCVTTRN